SVLFVHIQVSAITQSARSKANRGRLVFFSPDITRWVATHLQGTTTAPTLQAGLYLFIRVLGAEPCIPMGNLPAIDQAVIPLTPIPCDDQYLSDMPRCHPAFLPLERASPKNFVSLGYLCDDLPSIVVP
ncbi:hypothetical protein FRC12_010004, partial [Ceratobasidium sp. 428]